MAGNRYIVPFARNGSTLGAAEAAAVVGLLDSGQTLSGGNERSAFEAEFAAYTGARHALSLTSCSAALEFATYLLDLRAGDEVIAATQADPATVAPLLNLPVEVRFCDVDPSSLNVSPEAFTSLVNDRTRALYVTHHGGTPADMDPIMRIANEHGISVVEDCADALGARYHGLAPGTFGHFGCWSFRSHNNISTLGEGGMIAVARPEHAEVIGRIRALEPEGDFITGPEANPRPNEPLNDDVEYQLASAFRVDCLSLRHGGTNCTLSEPAAAVGRVQLRRLDALVARRREIADRLDKGLDGLVGIKVQHHATGVESARHLYTCFVSADAGLDRNEFMRRMDARGIQTRLRYMPVHLSPQWRFRGHRLGECPLAERLWLHEQVNLPIAPCLQDWQVDLMIETIRDVIGELGG